MKRKKTKYILSIIIVNWKTKKYLDICLNSIYENRENLSIETIVVDNNSNDGSIFLVKRSYPWVKLIANKTNRGFAKANNQGWEKSSGKYILFLNPDTIIHKKCFKKMTYFMDKHPKAGSCSARLTNSDGSDQKLGFYRKTPTLLSVILTHSPFTKIVLKISYLREKYFEHNDFSKTKEIDQPPGACFFTRSSILKKIGAMDEGYRLYFEDVDLAYRIKISGWKQYFLPKASITHFAGKGTAKLSHPKRSYLYYESMIRFFKKNYSMNCVKTVGIFILLRFIYELFTLSILFIPRKIFLGWGGRRTIEQELKILAIWIKNMKLNYENI